MLCHPAGLHIWRWFLDLSRTRGKYTVVIASMAGSQIINEPAAITWQEMAAWSQVTGRRLSLWESQNIAMVDTVYLATLGKGKGERKTGQDIGEYCNGRDLDDCRKQFGNEETLKQICSTCPN